MSCVLRKLRLRDETASPARTLKVSTRISWSPLSNRQYLTDRDCGQRITARLVADRDPGTDEWTNGVGIGAGETSKNNFIRSLTSVSLSVRFLMLTAFLRKYADVKAWLSSGHTSNGRQK
jgi:hypothetical protein